ncbi:hypothetical protein AGOR_G00106040 [Albula goreensis]|uniref:Uncharacterized protein n=1 Tax=Albula goreensis TaxID=1534307 RepID=A0A8T3DHU5_9TELE|nr:hypothetical protein AGOR_G00106040 [Albula goreensis]
MFSVLRGFPQTASRVRTNVVLHDHRSNIHSKPPREKIGPGQMLFAMSMFAVTLLAPAGWIMHHIPEYRQRTHPPANKTSANSIM